MNETNAIKNVLDGILAMSADTNKQAFESISGNPAVVSALAAIKSGDTEEFRYLFLHEIDSFIDGLLDSATDNNEAKFLFKHAEYVEAHFVNLITQFEGSGCSADKSRTIMRALASRSLSGKAIKFNYDAEITYHLPTLIFKTDDEIMDFFQALRSLHYGRPEQYLHALKNVTEKASERR